MVIALATRQACQSNFRLRQGHWNGLHPMRFSMPSRISRFVRVCVCRPFLPSIIRSHGLLESGWVWSFVERLLIALNQVRIERPTAKLYVADIGRGQIHPSGDFTDCDSFFDAQFTHLLTLHSRIND